MDEKERTEQRRSFFETIYGPLFDAEPEEYGEPRVLVCSSDDFAGAWLPSIDDAVSEVERRAARDVDIYAGAAWRARAALPRSGGRGDAASVSGITALWADIDVRGTVHAKERLPGSLDEALALVREAVPLAATLLVDSGHGLHAWWVLDEPADFRDSRDDRARYAALERRLVATLDAVARRHGWSVDRVADLARVMRVPGTRNYKARGPGAGVWAAILDESSYVAYSADDLDGVLVLDDDAADTEARRAASVGHLVLRPDASPDPMMLAGLLAHDEAFAATLENKRTDKPHWTASEYDLALASMAAAHDWTDQQIADLLIYHRRVRGHEPKTVRGALRQDYYQRTIARAKSGVEKEHEIARLADGDGEVGADIERARTGENAGKCNIISRISAILGTKVARIVQYGDDIDEARFVIEFGDGDVVDMGNARRVMEQRRFAEALFVKSHIVLDPMPRKAWKAFLEMVAAVVERRPDGETSYCARREALLLEYFAAVRVWPEKRYAVPTGSPFVAGGAVWINATHARDWARTSGACHVADVGRTMLLGTESIAVGVRPDDGDAGDMPQACRVRRYRRLPLDELTDETRLAILGRMIAPASPADRGDDSNITDDTSGESLRDEGEGIADA